MTLWNPKLFFNSIIWGLRTVKLREVRVVFEHCPLCGAKILLQLKRGIVGLRCLKCYATPIHMAMGMVLKEKVPQYTTKKIYELSAHGAFFQFLRKNVPLLKYSEFFDGVELGSSCGYIICQDVQALTFPDASFHVCTCTALFEHIPDDIKGFNEIFRVLKPGGHFFFSIPIFDTDETVERAKVVDGEIQHFLPAEYHDDIYVRGLSSALVYRDYGYDIIERLKSCGFVHVAIVDWQRFNWLQYYGVREGNGPLTRLVYASKG